MHHLPRSAPQSLSIGCITKCLCGEGLGGLLRQSNLIRQVVLPLSFLMLIFTSSIAVAQDASDFFAEKCASCHTIGGGKLVGPDLKGLLERQPDRDWLVRFIRDPKSMIDGGDPYALKIYDESNGVLMTTVAGIDVDRATGLIDLIEEESALEVSQFRGLQVDDRPFTDVDRELGSDLFSGRTRFVNGGPACIGCHTVRGIGGLGGGRLGPDLTKVYERLGGRTPLNAWLYSPPTEVMTSVFSGHTIEDNERRGLVSYLEHTATSVGDDDSNARLNFFLIGLGCAVFGLAVFDGIWRRRFRAVRRPLVAERYSRIIS